MEIPEVSDAVRLKIYRMPKMRSHNVDFIDGLIDAFQRDGLVIMEAAEPEVIDIIVDSVHSPRFHGTAAQCKAWLEDENNTSPNVRGGYVKLGDIDKEITLSLYKQIVDRLAREDNSKKPAANDRDGSWPGYPNDPRAAELESREIEKAAMEIMRRIIGTYVDDSDAIMQMIEEFEQEGLMLRPVKEVPASEVKDLIMKNSPKSEWEDLYPTDIFNKINALGFGFFKKP